MSDDESWEESWKVLIEIHGRLFQRNSVGYQVYCIPVDDEEEGRLDVQYDIMKDVKELYGFGTTPWYPNIHTPDNVLDCGYGFGNWAIEVANTYPDCKVRGVDIYPADLEEVPENLELDLCDLNNSLPTLPTLTQILQPSERKFDLINSSFVGPGIRRDRWPDYVKDLRRLTARNGWVQMVECLPGIQSDAGLLTQQHALHQWYGYYYQAMTGGNRDPNIGGQLQRLMRDASLVDVQGTMFSVPIGTWKEGQEDIGDRMLENIGEFLDSQAIWPFTQLLGWTKGQFDTFTARARVEAGDQTLKLYMRVYVAWGRRR